ncbi:MAG TPA: hypothetical protein VF152_14010 [Acidimicrobiia bacterium]
MSRPDAAAILATEDWFLKRGLPHFISHYSATRDVLTRALPVLTLIFLIEVANAPKRTFPVWLNAVAVAVGFAILLGAWMAANAVRGRRLLQRPDDVGVLEVAVFVLAPPAIPLVFGGQWRSAVVTALVNVGLLAAIYVVTSYGLVPMTRWAAGETARELNTVVGLFVRALPLLVLFVTFLFVTSESWQITATLYGPTYWIVLAMFPIVGFLFAAIRLPKEVGQLSDFETWDTLVGRVEGTPVATLARSTPEPAIPTPPLGRRQWGNVGLVVLFSQALQVFFVSAMVFVFLFVFGVLVMDEPTVDAFIGGRPHVLAALDWWGRHMVVTEELLRVTGFLTVFSGFYFAVAVLTDDTYRKEFLEEVVGEMRRSLAVRAVYLAALSSRGRESGQDAGTADLAPVEPS